MRFIADFHIHSHYSISTSKKLVPEYLDYWAKLKGIKVVGTGDFTHPGWLDELKSKLEPAEQGLFKLKAGLRLDTGIESTASSENEVRFLLTAEISNIYKKDGNVRKVHNLIFVPDFTTAEKLQRELSKIGNITSDGRPILGLDSRDLLEIVLNSSDQALFVPAHIWTPWFSVLGAKSGFDTISECYSDLAEHIFAVETGLSSDPPMNWMCRFLDKYTLISNSDAHSPEKLGREANLFDTELTYGAITQAIKTGHPEHFLGTIEFFPQEGKYHYDGHRKCGICWDPVETLKHDSVCPVCGKKVTIGVMSRVVQLADQNKLDEKKNRLLFYSLIPLKEILSEIMGVGPGSKRIMQAYNSLLQKAGSEFNVLLNLPIEEIKAIGNELLSEAVKRMRNREVFVKEGFDGEYGQIRVFHEDEIKSADHQELLFKDLTRERSPKKQSRGLINFDLGEYRILSKKAPQPQGKAAEPSLFKPEATLLAELNTEQQKAAEHFRGPALIIAGPGTGKTQTLTLRIANLIHNRGINPGNILAVTFTNKAAGEMKERLKVLLDEKAIVSKLKVSTFHAFGLSILREHCEEFGRNKHFTILGEADKNLILDEEFHCERNQLKYTSDAIADMKHNLISENEAEIFKEYNSFLEKQNAFDLDDLIYFPVKLFSENPAILSIYRNRYKWILIDEYQDINFTQYQLIRMLMPDKYSNLCVIGDPNQAIYGFRGADVKFIKRFIEDYPDAAVYRLMKSYRCSDLILQASSQVIQSEPSEKGIFLEGLNRGVKINIVENSTEKSEAEYVARTIEKMMGGLRFFSMDSQISEGNRALDINSLSDFAVLCRITKQMDALVKAFNDHSIPYQRIGDSPFFSQEPVSSVIDLLKALKNQQNYFLKNNLITRKIIVPSDLEKLDSLIKSEPVKNAISKIIDACFSSKVEKYQISFKKLLDLADNFADNMGEFINFASLGTGVDTYKPNTENVTLMTLHSAKGLEYKCVFIVGCEDKLLPYSVFENMRSNIDEERRLFYVGMTRAEKFLFLSHVKKRFLFGREYHLNKSPFLTGIERELTELLKTEYRKKIKKEDVQLNLF